MKITKEQMIYAGVGVFVFLILLNSTNKVALNEVTNENLSEKPFDSSSLPPQVKPPYRLAEGEEVPRYIKKNLNLNGISFKPRFDT